LLQEPALLRIAGEQQADLIQVPVPPGIHLRTVSYTVPLSCAAARAIWTVLIPVPPASPFPSAQRAPRGRRPCP
jgi:hypothetical protein